MQGAVQTVRNVVAEIEPVDALEGEHRRAALDWLDSTDDVFRREKPTTPAQHLVSYVVPRDSQSGRVLLIDHVNAGLWLPPGGHVEPGEHPADAAQRELREELGISKSVRTAQFITVTETVGHDAGHVDVSLWFSVEAHEGERLQLEGEEMRAARWWSALEIAAHPAAYDPHLGRYLNKISTVS